MADFAINNGLYLKKKLYITILAAGIGKRMNSSLPKVLHRVNGESMIVRLIKQVYKLQPEKIIIVVGKFFDLIKEEIDKFIPSNYPIKYTIQDFPLGTGDAVKSTLHLFKKNDIVNIILNGDVPMLQHNTIREIYENYLNKDSNFQITAIEINNPTGNGRIIIDKNNTFKSIVEEKDCTDSQKNIKLVNCGIYICSSDILLEFIPQIQSNNSQSEYYLTDLVKIYKKATNKNIDLFTLHPSKELEIFNVNTKQQLEYIEKIFTL